jgi:signal transduction histidine kinase
VGVSLQRCGAEVRLVVEDDGRGFDMETATALEPRPDRLGLAGMRERVSLLGGKLHIETGPGQGTSVMVSVPAANQP